MVQYKGDITRSKVTSDKKVSILKNKVTTERYSEKQNHNYTIMSQLWEIKPQLWYIKLQLWKKKESHIWNI